jgi:hypothetical protein
LISRDVTTREAASAFPALAGLSLVGAGLALLFPIRRQALAPLLALCSAAAMLKFVGQCPTCPRETFLGVDAALVGAALFAGLTGVVQFFGHKPSTNPALLLILTAVLIGQTAAWWSAKIHCPSCELIAFISAWAIGSSYRWLPESSRQFDLAYSFAGCAAFALLAIGSIPRFVASSQPQARHLAALGPPAPIDVVRIGNLGLRATGQRQILFVAAYGCHVCERALDFIDRAGISGVNYYYIGNREPDSKHLWSPLPNASGISITPQLFWWMAPGGL